MKRSRTVPLGSLALCLLGVAFCVWVHFGNSFSLCFTAGCALYQDTTIAGVSMWWLGIAGFALMGLLCLLRLVALARLAATLGLAVDTALLLLMVFTAPCVNCLIVALILFLAYLSLRRTEEQPAARPAPRAARPVLALLWALFFIVNVGAVARAEAGQWAISDDPETASVHVFFSPSCPSCRQAVERLSGRVDVAFYPLAENDQDIFRTARMEALLAEGASMREALAGALKEPEGAAWRLYTPDMLARRLRMLRNKAHIFTAGSTVVPYIEYRGLPAHLSAKAERKPAGMGKKAQARALPAAGSAGQGGDPTLPVDAGVAGFCDGDRPCDDPAPWQSRKN